MTLDHHVMLDMLFQSTFNFDRNEMLVQLQFDSVDIHE